MLHELLRRSAWLSAGSLVGRLSPLLVLIWTSRVMEPGQFASASAGFAWAGVAMALTSTGEATVMTQRLGSQTDASLRRGLMLRHALRALALASALAVVVCILGPVGARGLFGNSISAAVVVPAAVAGVLWSQVAMCVAALNGSHAARRASVTLALCGLSQGLAMALALTLWQTAQAVVWGLAVGSALAAALALWQTRQALGPFWRDARTAKTAVRQHLQPVALAVNPVLWNTLATVSVLPVTFFASSMIARTTDGTRQLAQYFALEQVHQVLVYLPAMLGQALLPMMSRRMAGVGAGPQSKAFMRRMAVAALVAAGLGAALALLVGLWPQWLIGLLKNPALQSQDGPAVRAMLLNAGLALSLSLLGGVFVGSGRIVVAALLNLLWGLIVVLATASWVDQGNLGLQQARVLASVVLILLACLLLWHHARWTGGSTPTTHRSVRKK